MIGARHAARHATAESLKVTSLSGTGTKRKLGVRATLVVSEMAVSAMLLVGALLIVRSVINLQRVDPGFDTARLYTMRFRLPADRYGSDARAGAFAAELLSRLIGAGCYVRQSRRRRRLKYVHARSLGSRRRADAASVASSITGTSAVRSDYTPSSRFRSWPEDIRRRRSSAQ
jgi:hypothetical protein